MADQVSAEKSSPEPYISKQVSLGQGQLEDMIASEAMDPALAARMDLVNNTIDEIGFTNYHTKLFFLNGFGYAVDSLLVFLMSITAGQIALEYSPSYANGGVVALYVALLFGALFWGITADMVGRKWAFNLSLLISAIFAISAGAAPNYIAWTVLVALSAFGSGGNLVLDTTVFLEYLPSNKRWLLTLLAAWWGVGQTGAGLIAWGFMSNYSCPSDGSVPCNRSNNMGWRYLYFTAGGLVFIMSIARVTIVRFHETPKYLICQGDDEAVVKAFTALAEKYNRPCSLTLEQLQECGQMLNTEANSFSFSALSYHYRGLFSSRKLALSTSLVWLSWLLIGLAYPLFYVFLPQYLATRGAEFGEESSYITWRNYAITNVCSIPGPIIAGFMCRNRTIGRKYTMVVGALLTMTFFFAYTAVRNGAQNLGFSSAISCVINIYYGTLYAYTPEVLPSAHRATGNGTAVAFNRFMGIMSAIIGTFADTTTSVPIYICAALFLLMAVVSVFFPFEPQNERSM